MLRYLPPYSPDLNPIEMAYGAFKTFLRKCAERTEDALTRRTGQFVRRLKATACANFFAHAGYETESVLVRGYGPPPVRVQRLTVRGKSLFLFCFLF